MPVNNYRKTQFDKIDTVYGEVYPPKIKIIKPNGETNWLNITEEELQKIKAILLGELK